MIDPDDYSDEDFGQQTNGWFGHLQHPDGSLDETEEDRLAHMEDNARSENDGWCYDDDSNDDGIAFDDV